MKPTTSRTGLEIAVIGMAGSFPGAADVSAFWRQLVAGSSTVSVLGDDELLAAGVHPALLKLPNFVRAKGVFPELEFFDAGFFDYTPRDAAMLDPQVRQLHQCVYHALQDAGYASEQCKASIGLFAGASGNFLWELAMRLQTRESAAAQFATLQLSDKDFVATRIAYKLNLRGPCVTLHCACSTSLYAIDLACRQLLTGACSMAVAAGSGLNLPHRNGYVHEEGMILSPDGACRPFSDDSNGTVEGNGMGAVVLKPLDDALRDGDRIHAVIRGTAANNDGTRKVGFSAPSVEGQAEAIRRALHMADVEPESISYVEAHGTGTALGDPVEIEGLKQAFRSTRTGFCGIGSLKSNIGHLDTAAGISSFIKTVLALQHRMLPPSIHFNAPNPQIDFEHSPFRVVTALQPWLNPPLPGGGGVHPLRAGVSSFGIGGTNVHVVLEEAPEAAPAAPGRPWQLLCLSGHDAQALARQEAAYADWIESHPGLDLADLAWTVQTGHRNLAHRRAVVFRDGDAAGLAAALRGAPGSEGARRVRSAAQRPRVVFLLPGQGTQHPGMAQGLWRDEPVFAQALEKCLALCERHGLWQLRPLLTRPAAEAGEADAQALARTELAQPALFAVEYALARLLMDWGVQPDALLGHSLGEYVAACLAGVMSLEEALALVLERGRLMAGMAPGSMLAVAATAEELLPLLPEGAELAAVNGPRQCTAAGTAEAIAALEAALQARGLSAKPLHTSHAFHSALMEPMLPAFAQALAGVALGAPGIPCLSNLSGTWMTAQQAQDPDYWCAHLRRPVRFADGARTLLAEAGPTVFIELGPGGVLGAFVRQCAEGSATPPVVLAALRHARADADDAQLLTRALGELWSHGVVPDWRRHHGAASRRKAATPPYPFAKTPFPLAPGDIYRLLEHVGAPAAASAPEPGRAVADDGPASPGWQDAPLPAPDDSTAVRACLALVENRRLQGALGLVGGLRVTACRPGEAFHAPGAGQFTADLGRLSDFRRLLQALREGDGVPGLFAWLAQDEAADPRALLERVTRLALALRSECPGHAARLLLVLPGPVPGEAAVAELDATLRGLRAACAPLELRALFTGARRQAPAVGAEALERELYDPERDVVLVAAEGPRRRVYRPLPLPPQPGGVAGLAGRTLALLAPEGFPLPALAARIEAASGARVRPVAARLLRPQARPSALRIDAQALRTLLRTAQAQDFARHGLRDFGDSHALLDEACTTLVAQLVHEALPLAPGHRLRREDVVAALRVTPRLERYVDLMLAMLAEDGVLAAEGAAYEVRRAPQALRPVEAIGAALSARGTLFDGNLRVLRHCMAQMAAALREDVAPISVLYPDGTNRLLSEAYEGSIQELEEALIRQVFEQLFGQLVARAQGRPLRILEAGGGFGLTMRRLAPLLRGVQVEYYFTDVGRTFLHDARALALREGWDFLSFGLFDITREPAAQGLEPGSFDLVLAFNVVHATRSLAQSVGHLKQLLRDGGLMCLLERTRARRYIDLIWGLAEGWWHFDAEERRLSPLTDLEHWQQVARAAGFAEVMAFPEDGHPLRRALECGILVAQTAPAAADAALPRWDIEPAPRALDGVIVLDAVPPEAAAPAFEPLGNALAAPQAQAAAFTQAVLRWLEQARPGFGAVWSAGVPLPDAAAQLGRARAGLDLDRAARRLLGPGNWSRVHLPGDALPDAARTAQALAAMQGRLAQAVLGAARQPLFALPAPQPAAAEAPAAGAEGAPLLDEGGVQAFEALLHKAWAELFGIDRIGADEDFFELGGDSLKVAQLTAELEKYGLRLLSNEVFNHPTIRLLARYLHDNRQGELGSVRSPEALVAHFAEQGIAARWLAPVHEGRPVRVLYLADDALAAGSADALQALAGLRLPRELQPQHVAPLSRLPAPGAQDDALAVLRALGLAGDALEERWARAALQVAQGMQALNRRIAEAPVLATYPLSPFQKMFLKEANRVTFYLIDFDEPLDAALLERAFGDVVALQGLLRSRLRRDRRRRLVWDEFAPPRQAPSIPLLDFGDCLPALQAQLMERLMQAENGVDFDAAPGVMWRAMLVRFDRCRHTLLFNLDHSIFDNMSGQVLRRQLLTRYRQLRAGHVAPMAPVKSFRDYLQQLARGPQGITRERLVQVFDLARYQRAKEAVEARIVARRQDRIQTLRYALDLDRWGLSDDDEATWEITLAVLCCTLGRFLEQDAVPLKLIYQGRQYQDLSWFDTLGLFIDVLPLLVPVERDDPAAMIEGIRRKIRCVNRFNVNFMNMLMSMVMRFKWWDVLRALSPKKLSRRDPMILLNYVGKAEAEYQKVIEFSTRQMMQAQGNQGYASLYIVVTRVERTILFDLFCNFEPDMSVLQRLFEQESERLLSRMAAGPGPGPDADPGAAVSPAAPAAEPEVAAATAPASAPARSHTEAVS